MLEKQTFKLQIKLIAILAVLVSFLGIVNLVSTAKVHAANDVPETDSSVQPASILAKPTLVAPTNGATGISTSPTLTVHLAQSKGGTLAISFYGRAEASVSANFDVIALPDTQRYTAQDKRFGGSPAIFNSQTQWIANNRATENIVFVSHLGDITNCGDGHCNVNDRLSAQNQWKAADTAMKFLENPLTTGLSDGIPYGILPGNHDQPTKLYNTYFGVTRFSGRSYYGGHYGSDNNNNYQLFSAGGMDFIAISLGNNPSKGAIAWADGLLKTYKDRRAIVSSHDILTHGIVFSSVGKKIYKGLQNNPNLFLMLCGHVIAAGWRSDTYLGNTVYSLLSDYEWESNGGNGYLRIMKFVPSQNQIQVKTYSPYLNQWKTDSKNQFNLDYRMGYTLISTVNQPSGVDVSIPWPGLTNSTQYSWYAVVNDGVQSAPSDVWNFVTAPKP